MNSKGKDIFLQLFLFLFCIYLLIFPFGQIFKFSILINGRSLPVNPIDILVVLSIPIYFVLKPPINSVLALIRDFLLAAMFSYVFSLSFISFDDSSLGLMYLIRLIAYFTFTALVIHSIRESVLNSKIIYNILVYESIIIAALGLIQYFAFPDLRFLKAFNWDDHLYRLAGSFLDPAFTGLFIVFGIIISLVKYLENKKFQWILIITGLFICLLLTYSRASYLSLFAGLIYLGYVKGLLKWKILILGISLFLMGLLVLPRKSSEGTSLSRTQSIAAKFANGGQTLAIARTSPVFGIGFNNICFVRTKVLGGNVNSHACSGADSSLLFVLATSGVVGLTIFIKLILSINNEIPATFYGYTLKASGTALLVHGLFTESLFYPFVMGYMGILLAISLNTKK